MGIVANLKNALRKTLFSADNTTNFTMEEMKRVVYPYTFFYISDFHIDEQSKYNWRNVVLNCVIEYQKEEETKNIDNWTYAETLQNALLPCFEYEDIKITPMNTMFRIVEGVLQMTFNLNFYVKEQEVAELMQELQFTIITEAITRP